MFQVFLRFGCLSITLWCAGDEKLDTNLHKELRFPTDLATPRAFFKDCMEDGIFGNICSGDIAGTSPCLQLQHGWEMGLGSSALVLDIPQCPQLPTDTLWAISGGAGHILLSCYAHSCPAVALNFGGWKLARQGKEMNNYATIFLALYLCKTGSEWLPFQLPHSNYI